MAEVTAMRNNALPYPIYGSPFTIVYPFLDADGDLVTGASTPDAEVSKNGDTFADCTNESTEIATSSGVYYLTLTATEMTADVITVIAKSATSGMKTTVATLYPRKLVTIRSGTSASAGSATSTIVLDASASAVDDFYNGMVCIATIDSNVEVRVISDYVGSTQTASVVPDWNVAPDNNDTFVVKLTEGGQIQQSNVTAWNGTTVPGTDTAGYPKVTIKDGTGAGELDTSSGVVLAKDHTGANLATAAALDAVDNFIDTEVQAIKDKTDLIPGTQDGKTFAETLLLIASVLLGKASGLGTTTAVFRSLDDAHDRVTATVDADGNRSAVTLDASSP